MSEKFALYLPKKVIKILKEKATASQFREFMIGLDDYDDSETVPVFNSDVLNVMFSMVKTDLDWAKMKYKNIIEKRREAGRLGGLITSDKKAEAARENGETGGRPPKKPKQTGQMLRINNEQKITQADKSSQIKGIDKVVSSSNDVVFSEQPTTTTFLNFCINKQKAQELCTGIDLSWLSGAFTYPEYIAEAIQENYPDKPQNEKTKLFIKIFSAEDRKDAYPQWREVQKAEAKKRAASEKLTAAKNNHPTKCVFCGGKKLIAGYEVFKCVMCNAVCEFKNGKWVWEK